VGAFQYHVEHDDSKFGKLANDKIVTCNKNVLSMTEHSTGYFVIDPMMQVMRHTPTGIVNEMLTLDGIVLQSVIPKWLGPIDTWPAQMANAARLGYNMIHYAPMQVRGESNSPYSIYDQLALADELFDPSALPDQTSRWEKLGNILKQIETDSGVLAVADVVLNHTANNSPWLQLHPEAGKSSTGKDDTIEQKDG
jgi:glycogen debranching enzyme